MQRNRSIFNVVQSTTSTRFFSVLYFDHFDYRSFVCTMLYTSFVFVIASFTVENYLNIIVLTTRVSVPVVSFGEGLVPICNCKSKQFQYF